MSAAATITGLEGVTVYRDPLDGQVLRFASYDNALTEAEVNTHYQSFQLDGGAQVFSAWQTTVNSGSPATVILEATHGSEGRSVDVGTLSGGRSFEFIVNAGLASATHPAANEVVLGPAGRWRRRPIGPVLPHLARRLRSRQRVDLSTRVANQAGSGSIGSGVQVASLRRVFDSFVVDQVREHYLPRIQELARHYAGADLSVRILVGSSSKTAAPVKAAAPKAATDGAPSSVNCRPI